MIFPIGDTQVRGGSTPVFSYAFMAINVVAFAIQLNVPGNLICEYGVIPEEIKSGHHLITLVTSLFLHGGYLHILGNLMFLWVFADNVEAVIGNLRFLVFYIGGGIIASLAHIYLGTPSTDIIPCCAPCTGCETMPVCSGLTPSLGASGSISAIMGAYLLMFPASRIKVLVLIFFSSFYVSAWVFLGLWFLQQLFAGIGSTSEVAQQAESGVAWWAHIGGFVFGMLTALYFRNKPGIKAVINNDSRYDQN